MLRAICVLCCLLFLSGDGRSQTSYSEPWQVPGSNGQVLFNDSGVPGANPNLTWSTSSRVLTSTGGFSGIRRYAWGALRDTTSNAANLMTLIGGIGTTQKLVRTLLGSTSVSGLTTLADGPWEGLTAGTDTVAAYNRVMFALPSFGTSGTQTRWAPTVWFVIETGVSIANERLFFGCFSLDPANNADPSASNAMAFRYDSALDGTTWHTYINNGTTGGSVSDTGVTIAVSTVYVLVINATNAASITFTINNVLAATLTGSELPTTSVYMAPLFEIVNLNTAATRIVNIQRLWVEQALAY